MISLANYLIRATADLTALKTVWMNTVIFLKRTPSVQECKWAIFSWSAEANAGVSEGTEGAKQRWRWLVMQFYSIHRSGCFLYFTQGLGSSMLLKQSNFLNMLVMMSVAIITTHDITLNLWVKAQRMRQWWNGALCVACSGDFNQMSGCSLADCTAWALTLCVWGRKKGQLCRSTLHLV